MDFILTRPAEDHRLTADGAETRVARVVVGHRHEARLGLGDGVTGLWVWRIGEDDAFSAAHSEAGVAEPGHVHRECHDTRNFSVAGGVPVAEGAQLGGVGAL